MNTLLIATSIVYGWIICIEISQIILVIQLWKKLKSNSIVRAIPPVASIMLIVFMAIFCTVVFIDMLYTKKELYEVICIFCVFTCIGIGELYYTYGLYKYKWL